MRLFEAIRRNDEDLIEKIVQEVSLANSIDRRGTVPLMVVACSDHGSASIGALLLKRGALRNQTRMVTGESAIHLAAERVTVAFCQMLLKARKQANLLMLI